MVAGEPRHRARRLDRTALSADDWCPANVREGREGLPTGRVQPLSGRNAGESQRRRRPGTLARATSSTRRAACSSRSSIFPCSARAMQGQRRSRLNSTKRAAQVPCPLGADVCLVEGSDPPVPTPEPLSAALFQPFSECVVSGSGVLVANGHRPKEDPRLDGTLEIPRPCLPARRGMQRRCLHQGEQHRPRVRFGHHLRFGPEIRRTQPDRVDRAGSDRARPVLHRQLPRRGAGRVRVQLDARAALRVDRRVRVRRPEQRRPRPRGHLGPEVLPDRRRHWRPGDGRRGRGHVRRVARSRDRRSDDQPAAATRRRVGSDRSSAPRRVERP